MPGLTVVQNWKYLFIIEGSLTIFLAIVSFILLPRNLQASRYFSADEKHCGSIRLAREAEVETTKFSWKATLLPLMNWHTWMFGFMALCYGVAAASISNFLPVCDFSLHSHPPTPTYTDNGAQ